MEAACRTGHTGFSKGYDGIIYQRRMGLRWFTIQTRHYTHRSRARTRYGKSAQCNFTHQCIITRDKTSQCFLTQNGVCVVLYSGPCVLYVANISSSTIPSPTRPRKNIPTTRSPLFEPDGGGVLAVWTFFSRVFPCRSEAHEKTCLLVVLVGLVVDDVEELELVDAARGGDDAEPVAELLLLEELLRPVVVGARAAVSVKGVEIGKQRH